ncbi:unnamed protein product [Nesidiocoris tenuis]|uniref:Uncharacterized protein n=1 Tax=Nesidiocoris tenuis TaxID=355587 RepID=A0A6H5HC81_9HEMI|nr:unnamed protein product [Nesidiocoris tenuis]
MLHRRKNGIFSHRNFRNRVRQLKNSTLNYRKLLSQLRETRRTDQRCGFGISIAQIRPPSQQGNLVQTTFSILCLKHELKYQNNGPGRDREIGERAPGERSHALRSPRVGVIISASTASNLRHHRPPRLADLPILAEIVICLVMLLSARFHLIKVIKISQHFHFARRQVPRSCLCTYPANVCRPSSSQVDGNRLPRMPTKQKPRPQKEGKT